MLSIAFSILLTSFTVSLQPENGQYDSLENELSQSVSLPDSLELLIELAEYQNFRDQDASLQWLEIALPLAEKLDDKSKLGAIYALKGGVYMDKGKNPDALSLMKQSLNIYRDLQDSAKLANIYTNIALCYQVNHLYDSAMVYYYHALAIDEARKDEWGLGYSYDNLGFIFYTMGDTVKAYNYLHKALALRQKNDDKPGIAITSIHFGGYFKMLQQYDSALHYYNKGIKIFTDEGYNMHVSTAKIEMHEAYVAMGKYEEASTILDEVLEFELGFNNLENTIYTYISKAKLASEQGDFTKAENYLAKCDELIAGQSKDAPLTNAVYVELYEAYYKFYQKTGQYKKSLEAAIQHYEYKEKQSLEKAMLKLNLLDSEQKLSKKEAELKAVQLSNDLLVAENKFFSQTLFLIILLVITVSIGIVCIYVIRQRNLKKLMSKNSELEKINKALDRFVYSVSHDLKAPIASSKGLINLMRMEEHSEVLAQYLNMQEISLKKLEEFILEILEYSRNARTDLKLDNIQFQDLIGDVFGQLEHFDGSSDVQKNMHIHQKDTFVSDLSRIKVIVNNLVSNSIRYRNPHITSPEVNVFIRVDAERASIEIKDNGLGIGKDHQDKIFDMFYRAHSHKNGSGLGLYIVKETIEKLEGIISLESSPNKGTSFFIELPNLHARVKKPKIVLSKASSDE